jgi:hypothetical protein
MNKNFGIILQIVGALVTATGSLIFLFVGGTWFSRPWHHHLLPWALLIIPGVLFNLWGQSLDGEFKPPPSPKARDWKNN